MEDQDIPLANSDVLYKSLIGEADYSVTRTTVRPGGETQWHHHNHVSDRFVVVRGVLTVEFREGSEVRKVEVRDYYALAPGVHHHVRNETQTDVVYINVQSGGERDIVIE
jgi:beta-alanine degradation protein BauB